MERQGVARISHTRGRRETQPAARPLPGTSLSIHPILHLQHALGNQAVLRVLRSRGLQAKLTVGRPGDPYEQEADRLAEEVMRMPDPAIRPKPT